MKNKTIFLIFLISAILAFFWLAEARTKTTFSKKAVSDVIEIYDLSLTRTEYDTYAQYILWKAAYGKKAMNWKEFNRWIAVMNKEIRDYGKIDNVQYSNINDFVKKISIKVKQRHW
jgi:hypothetical protein